MKWGIPLGLIVVFVAIVVHSASVPADDRVAQGKKIYADQCISCHANDGSGNVPRGKAMKVPDLRTPEMQKKTDAQLTKGILEAKRHPSFKKMGNEDLARVVAYMRTLK